MNIHQRQLELPHADERLADALYSEEEKYFDYRNDLHRVTAKTLIIVGEQDWICPPSEFAPPLCSQVFVR